MRLTRMALDTTKRRTMVALSSPSIIHGIVEKSFPNGKEPKLWRLDNLCGTTYLLILSTTEPDLTEATAQLGYDGRPWESKDYDPLLRRITDGSRWRFRLCANPTHTAAVPCGRGKVRAHTTPDHQLKWLVRQGEKHGFSVTADNVAVVESRSYHFGKGGGRKTQVHLISATYEGLLTVTNSELFLEILQCGLGREKAYGMGLMTLMSLS